MPTTDCLPQVRLDFHPTRAVDANFDLPELSSDAGALLLRQVDDRLGLSALIAGCLVDRRDPRRVLHTRLEQVRQRVFQIALGYEDGNDAGTLRHDRLLKVACDLLPEEPRGLSSQPSLSRLEHAVTAREVVGLQRALEKAYVDELPSDTKVVVLDIDTTDDPTHGQQPLTFFNAHYDTTMYFPVLLFDDEGRLVSVRLRPGNAGNYRYAAPMLERVIRLLKARFPSVQVVVRGDGGFCAPRLLDRLDALAMELGDVEYVLGIKKNAVLERLAAEAMTIASARYHEARRPVRVFTSFLYRARSWSRDRYVVAKAEHLPLGPNPRFIVSSFDHVPPHLLYERGYCGRGQSENYIKDFKNALHGGRLSCTTYVANAFRLLVHAAAYRLLFALRTHVAHVAPALANAQFDTMRLRLLKVAARVVQTVRRVVISLPSAFPLRNVFRALLVSLQAAPVPVP
ncbi:MAG: IS1380 family transposase [Deltaproteobacteria bacterium]|nr:IS1380 family transposase [Deltaproteobacteria bacterium]